MKQMLGYGTITIGLLLVLPDDARGQKKEENKKTSNVMPATPDDYKTLIKKKEVSGIIVSADVKSLVFRIDVGPLQPSAGPKRPANAKTRAYKEFELDVSDAVVVKKMFIKADYDDKGNFKLDEKANKELRAKGFIASKIEDVKSGNIARITLTAPKKADEVEGVGNLSKPLVKTIVLDKEGTPVEPAKTMEKKKKN